MVDASLQRARLTRLRQIRRGISWNVANLFVNRGMSILVRLFLARLLVPEDFGLVAMILVVLGLLEIFVDLGLKHALIQRKRDANSLVRYDSAFWFLLVGGVCWTTLYILFGIPLMIWFYGEPQLYDLALVMGFSILFQSLSILPEVRLTRRMRFRSLVISRMVSTILASLLAVGLAFGGAGVWALAAQQLASSALLSVMLWRFANWRPRRRFAWPPLREVVGFSGWMLGNQLTAFLRKNSDKLIIGSILGAGSLGIYTIAFMLTETFRSQISTMIGKVMFPAYSRHQNDLDQVKHLYIGVVKYTSLIVFPICIFLILFSDTLIVTLFGEQWLGAAPPLAILSVASMIFALSGDPSNVLRAIGRPRIAFYLSLWNTLLVALPALLIGTWLYGIEGAAWGVVVHYITSRIAFQIYLRQIGLVSEAELAISLVPAILVSIILVFLVAFFGGL